MTKSCTTKDDDYPIIYRVLTIPGGAGFCPSTVSNYFDIKLKKHLIFPKKFIVASLFYPGYLDRAEVLAETFASKLGLRETRSLVQKPVEPFSNLMIFKLRKLAAKGTMAQKELGSGELVSGFF